KGEHGIAYILALDDVTGALGALDQVVDERVDAVRARVAERCELSLRKVLRLQNAEPQRVVDVVVDVGDAVDDANDLALERRRFAFAGVREDSVAYFLR